MKRHKSVHFGTVSESLEFIPNHTFLYAAKQLRNFFVFPPEWYVSAAFKKIHLSPSAVTHLTQSITEQHRMDLLRLRIARLKSDEVCADDSTNADTGISALHYQLMGIPLLTYAGERI